MEKYPYLETSRLILSQLDEGDIPLIVEYLQEKVFSELTANIPYPYSEEDARFWLNMCREAFDKKAGFNFAIRNKEGVMMGAIGLHDRGEGSAELGYWMGKPYWNNGYVTEAARAVVDYGFQEQGFNKIYATHFPHNPASGRTLQKIGMQKEDLLKEYIKKDGDYLDALKYSVLRNKD